VIHRISARSSSQSPSVRVEFDANQLDQR
jgi:hypothetical protein